MKWEFEKGFKDDFTNPDEYSVMTSLNMRCSKYHLLAFRSKIVSAHSVHRILARSIYSESYNF